MVKSFYFVVFLSLVVSCASLKQKKALVKKLQKGYFDKYPIDSQFLERSREDGIVPYNLSSRGFMSTSDSSLRNLSIKKIKIGMKSWEKGLAIVPDSVSRKGTKIDSFYYNHNKINFIKDNKLLSDNIFFYKKL